MQVTLKRVLALIMGLTLVIAGAQPAGAVPPKDDPNASGKYISWTGDFDVIRATPYDGKIPSREGLTPEEAAIVYCFNRGLAFPPDGNDVRWDEFFGNDPTAWPLWTLQLSNSFAGLASKKRSGLSDQEISERVLRVLYNGYPRNAALSDAPFNLKNLELSYAATQYAIWYYSDSVSLPTLVERMYQRLKPGTESSNAGGARWTEDDIAQAIATSIWLTGAKIDDQTARAIRNADTPQLDLPLRLAELEKVELKNAPAESHLDTYIPGGGMVSAIERKPYQNLLGAVFKDSEGKEIPEEPEQPENPAPSTSTAPAVVTTTVPTQTVTETPVTTVTSPTTVTESEEATTTVTANTTVTTTETKTVPTTVVTTDPTTVTTKPTVVETEPTTVTERPTVTTTESTTVTEKSTVTTTEPTTETAKPTVTTTEPTMVTEKPTVTTTEPTTETAKPTVTTTEPTMVTEKPTVTTTEPTTETEKTTVTTTEATTETAKPTVTTTEPTTKTETQTSTTTEVETTTEKATSTTTVAGTTTTVTAKPSTVTVTPSDETTTAKASTTVTVTETPTTTVTVEPKPGDEPKRTSSVKEVPWWVYIIPAVGLIPALKGGSSTKETVREEPNREPEPAPKQDDGDTVIRNEGTGDAVPVDSGREEIKHVPSGAIRWSNDLPKFI